MAEIQAAEAEAAAAQPLPIDQFWTLGPELEGLHFEIRGPDVPGAVLRLLGRPPGWGGQEELQATLHDLYRVASASVRDAALRRNNRFGRQSAYVPQIPQKRTNHCVGQ